ncbi:MAG: Cof-type HAD-IIB family hydrolase [Anaerolineae bacterium]|nr:Cof-type HAD-IIB family hydrolase [Anaerolineae bacterium]
MTDFKLLVLDVDGTLIGSGAYPTTRVVQAIAQARARGVTVALGTGRASAACHHLLEQLCLDKLHIFFDGALIVDWPSNDIIFLQSLPPRASQRLIELSRQHGLFLEIYAHNFYAHDFYFVERNGALAAHQREKLQITPLVTDLMSLVEHVKIVKGQLLATSAQEVQQARLVTQEMEVLCKMSWSLDPSNNIYFINAISRAVSKGDSLRNVADYLGIGLDQIMAIGDSFNDLPVFEVAGFSVAMGNSPAELKELADWVAPPVEKDGVAVAIEQFIL